MLSLFDLPLEIRDQIIEEAIVVRHSIPTSPSECKDRENLPNTFDGKWAPETNIYVQRGQSGSAQASLLRTNRRLRAETLQALRRLEGEPYLLDVMFVKHCGIFPTWYSFPGRRRQIKVLHVRLRIFDATEDLDAKWLEKAVYTGSEDGSARTGWNMMVLLTVFLLHGFHNCTRLEDEKGCHDTDRGLKDHEDVAPGRRDTGAIDEHWSMVRHTIKRVEIYVEAPDPKAVSSTEAPQAQPPMSEEKRNSFGSTFFRRYALQTPAAGPAATTEQTILGPQITRQREMLNRITRTIGIMCNHNYPYDLYGSLLFRNIGSIRMWAGGAFWTHMQMTLELCRQYGLGVEALAEAYPGWLRDTVKRMKQEGLWDARCARTGKKDLTGTNEVLFG